MHVDVAYYFLFLFLISCIFPAEKSCASFHIKRRTKMIFCNSKTLTLEWGECLNIFVNNNTDSGSACCIRHMLIDAKMDGLY